MHRVSLLIEYITGYAVATDPTDRRRAEWPPHPARVFMALAAAHFETEGPGSDKRLERDALEWLATLGPPAMTLPEPAMRTVQTVFVPVNDQSGADALLGRSRQPREFPRAYVGQEPVWLAWSTPAEPPSEYLDALRALCRKVTRIGHSSSLVWVRLECDAAVLPQPTHTPDESAPVTRVRVVHSGAMTGLDEAFNSSDIEKYDRLEAVLQASHSKSRKGLQEALARQFPRGRPIARRPLFPISCGYGRVLEAKPATPHTLFDPNFIVLCERDGAPQSFGLESTAQIAHALRGLVMSESGVQPVPSWVGGHEPGGQRLESGPHLSVFPLAFIDHAHADGHLMGFGIAVPRSIALHERAKVFAPMLFDKATNQPRTLHLRMGRAGDWYLNRDTAWSPRRTLRIETYNGPSRTWASVTPALLDRMPKSDRVRDPLAWRQEVAGLIAQSCDRVFDQSEAAQRPAVIAVRVEKTPFFVGSLRAMPGQGGFPQLRKDKHQVHVVVEFDRPVQGPLLIGAGRFFGYGLMRPWDGGKRR